MATNNRNPMLCRKFYLTIEYAEDLPNVREVFKTRAYARVLIGSTDRKIKLQTNSDDRNGLNPVWNQAMSFDISESAVLYYGLSVTIKLYTERSLGPDRYIGEINTTIKDLYDGAWRYGGSARQAVAIRQGTKETDGVLHFCYSFGRETFAVERRDFLRRALQFAVEIMVEGVSQAVVLAVLGVLV